MRPALLSVFASVVIAGAVHAAPMLQERATSKTIRVFEGMVIAGPMPGGPELRYMVVVRGQVAHNSCPAGNMGIFCLENVDPRTSPKVFECNINLDESRKVTSSQCDRDDLKVTVIDFKAVDQPFDLKFTFNQAEGEVRTMKSEACVSPDDKKTKICVTDFPELQLLRPEERAVQTSSELT